MVQRAEGTVEHVCVALPLYADAEGSCATWGGLWRSGAREHVCVPVLLFCAAHSHGVSLAVPLLVPHLIHMHRHLFLTGMPWQSPAVQFREQETECPGKHLC
jgi:hypothetical protein